MTEASEARKPSHRCRGSVVYLYMICLVLFLITSLSAFSQEESAPPLGGTIVERDIVYYDGPGFNPQRHILDLYRPAGRDRFPVLIFIHGGSWQSGNKNLYGLLGYAFSHAGFGVVIANYRLTDGSPRQVVHPGHIEDVARAFAWVKANLSNYGGDPEKIFISGHSAGGHLVALLALDPQYLAAHDLSTDDIAGVLVLSGVYDVRSSSLAQIFGETIEQRAQASPITHVGERQPPPFQIIYAQYDLGGLPEMAVQLQTALSELPSESELIEIAGRDHITIILRLPLPGDPAAEAMLRFLNEHAYP
ncbi:MAG: alpha/beta hydrolase [Acidobacteria bacterium]|nr:alpha/beta hydrolase [Acidobacteriota bacterium]MBI3657501.1 alpha/beta hydrolase [Acidobacteriota bacterium]